MAPARRNPESGFVLVFVLAMAAAIAIALYAALPRVAFEAQRQKEQVLISNGEEYKRAIQLYVRKFSRYPGTLEALENTNNMRFLRRRYKDPMTGKDEWRLIHAGPGGVFTDSLTMKPNRPTKDKDGKDTGISEIGASSTTDPAAPPAPLTIGRRRRPSDSAIPAPTQGLEGQTSGDYQPPPENPDENNQAGAIYPGAPQPGQPQLGPQAGQPDPMQTAQEGEGGVVGGFQQPGVEPQQAGQTGQPVQPVQQPGFGPQPMAAGQQAMGPGGQIASGQMVGGAAMGGGPAGFRGQPQQFAQQPINPVTPYAPQPAIQQPGAMDASGNQGTQNPVDLINQQLRGGTVRQPGFAGPGGSQTLGGGIAGVASKAENEGIKIYRKHTKYKEWEFIYDPKQDLTSPTNRGMVNQPGLGGAAPPSLTGNRRTQ